MSAPSPDAVCSQVARLLREERERKGMSMTTLAERAGLSQQMISYIERELRNPTLNTLLRVTDALELDAAEVLRRARCMAEPPRRHP